MLKLILDHHFRVPVPAVDQSPFSNHGRVIDASFAADGRSPGSGALKFQQAGSAVRIAWKPVWQKLTALCVEAWVNMTPGSARRNIVEGDGSFALFLDPDDTLVGSVFSLVDGATAPAWNTVSSRVNAPDGAVHRVPPNQWSKLVFHHDGITRARLFLDDRLVGVRGDYRSGVGAVASAGVVIGNWTLANQFAFSGSIDRVRVWKRDEYAVIDDFNARPVDPAARDAWDDIWACLGQVNVDNRLRLQRLGADWEQVLREVFRALHAASEEDRERFRSIVTTYRTEWRANAIDSAVQVEAVVQLRDWIVAVLGPTWLSRARQLAEAIVQVYAHGRPCVDPERTRAVDPQLAGFLANVANRIPDNL